MRLGKRVKCVYFYAQSIFLLSLFFQPNLGISRETSCETTVAKFSTDLSQSGLSLSVQNVALSLKFAEKFNLRAEVLAFGPPELDYKRLVVAFDYSDPAQLKEYFETYNLTTAHGEIAGHLVIEFEKDGGTNGGYTSGILRTSPNPTELIWRWGAQQNQQPQTWHEWLNYFESMHAIRPGNILGFSHVLPLSKDRLENVQKYLKSPALRAPCKSSNCVAWLSSIELGLTDMAVSEEERQFLSHYLGFARSSAHFEIGRRLIHASNQNHSVLFVLAKGPSAIKKFWDNPGLQIPPDPQIPYQQIIRGSTENLSNLEAKVAVQAIPDGAKIFFPIAAGASPEAFSALAERASTLDRGFEINVLVNGISASSYEKAHQKLGPKLKLNALFLGGNLRNLNRQGAVNVMPGNLSDFTRWMIQGEPDFQFDVIVVRVAPPKDGRYSLGPNNDQILTIIKNRPNIIVVAEVNANIPVTFGENYLTEKQIHQKFTSTTQLSSPAFVPMTQVELQIAANLATLVASDSYVQIGIGNLFDGLADALKAKNTTGIKIHTEMFSDAAMNMIKNGVAESGEAGFGFGSVALYKWLDQNKSVKFLSTEYINDPGFIQTLPQFTAINTALQVSLTGEVNATNGPDGYQISSPGGQVEFMFGASRSPNGKAVIAVRSTAKNGTVSSLALDLYPGAVTTPREIVSDVVTEYGIAHLRGKSVRERTLAILRIAHPQFKKDLATKALARGLIHQQDLTEF